MKRIVIISLLTVFTAASFFFHLFGAQLRDMLSPEVGYVYARQDFYDSALYMVVPKECVHSDADGSFIYVAKEDDRYPERAFKAVKRYIEIVPRSIDGGVYLTTQLYVSDDERIITVPAGSNDTVLILKDGERIKFTQ